jgi:hypothetical protein
MIILNIFFNYKYRLIILFYSLMVNKKDTKDKKDKDKIKKNKNKNERGGGYESGGKNDENKFKFNKKEIIRNIKDKFTRTNVMFLIGFIVVYILILFQYKYETSRRDPTGMDEGEEDPYETLKLEPNADLATIRKQYKKLAIEWHPDKHQDCQMCKEKFNQITKAYEILSDDAKKGEYESKSSKSIFGSQPVSLTEKNYHHLVEESNDFWVIIVYENRKKDGYLQHVADIWDEVSSKYRNIIKFGAIDILKHDGLLHYLPYKFPIIPSIITHLHGEDYELFQNIDSLSVRSKKQ